MSAVVTCAVCKMEMGPEDEARELGAFEELGGVLLCSSTCRETWLRPESGLRPESEPE